MKKRSAWIIVIALFAFYVISYLIVRTNQSRGMPGIYIGSKYQEIGGCLFAPINWLDRVVFNGPEWCSITVRLGYQAGSMGEALEKAPSFQEYKRRVKNASYHIDKIDADDWLVGVGEDFPEHWVRGLNLKVMRSNGAIYKEIADNNGELQWILDYKPGNQ